MQAGDIELYDEEKSRWIPLQLVNVWDEKGEHIRPRIVLEQLFASEAGSDASRQLLPHVQQDWSRGIGLDYDWAPGLYAGRSPGYVCPAGSPVAYALPAGRTDAGPINYHAEYGGDKWFAQIGTATKAGAVLRSVGGDAALTDASPGGLVAGEYVRGMVVADVEGTGVELLLVMTSDGGVASGRIHAYDGSSWLSTAAGDFGANGRGPAAVVFWTTGDGVPAARLLTISGPRAVSYTKPFADPMDPASWVEDVRITGSRGQLRQIAAAKTHAWLTAEDGLFDLQETGESPNLMSYLGGMVAPGNGYAAQYHDGAVFMAVGTGLDRVIVDTDGMLQETPGMCGPGWGTRVENPVLGWTTAMCVDQGFLVAALFNPSTRSSYVCYGKSRAILQIDGPNPMIWYGPEVVISGDLAKGGTRVTAMSVSSLVSGQRRLWISWTTDDTTESGTFYVTVPVAGAPLQEAYSQGSHKYNRGLGDTGSLQPVADLYPMPNAWDDFPSLKIIHEHAVGSRGLSVTTAGADDGFGTKLVEYDRADPAPGSQAWGTGTDVTVGPSQTIQPAATTRGYELWRKISFVSPQGTATTPKAAFLRSLRTTVWKVAPSFNLRVVTVQHGSGGVDRHLGGASSGLTHDPEYVAGRIQAIIADGGLTVLRDGLGRRKNVRLAQEFSAAHVYLPDRSPRQALEMKLSIIVIGDAA